VTSWPFLARFVAWAAAAFILWAVLVAEWYVSLLAALGPYVAAAVGAAVEIQDRGRATRAVFTSPAGPVGLHLETAALGVLPFFALLGATTWCRLRHRLIAAAIGSVVFLVFHLTLFVAYPFFLSRGGLVVDSLGAFWAILIYCGFPFILWLVVLRIGTAARPASTPPSASAPATRKGKAKAPPGG
jgi:hypothetical protein